MDRELLREHEARNRDFWNGQSDEYQQEHGAQLAVHGAAWGIWQIPEDEVQALGSVTGRDVIELGCGAAQWSIALARRGARPVGVDLSETQLAHARRRMRCRSASRSTTSASPRSRPAGPTTSSSTCRMESGFGSFDPTASRSRISSS